MYYYQRALAEQSGGDPNAMAMAMNRLSVAGDRSQQPPADPSDPRRQMLSLQLEQQQMLAAQMMAAQMAAAEYSHQANPGGQGFAAHPVDPRYHHHHHHHHHRGRFPDPANAGDGAQTAYRGGGVTYYGANPDGYAAAAANADAYHHYGGGRGGTAEYRGVPPPHPRATARGARAGRRRPGRGGRERVDGPRAAVAAAEGSARRAGPRRRGRRGYYRDGGGGTTGSRRGGPRRAVTGGSRCFVGLGEYYYRGVGGDRGGQGQGFGGEGQGRAEKGPPAEAGPGAARLRRSGLAAPRSSLLEEFKSNKGSRRFSLSDLTGHVVEFASDQHGSRFIQQELDAASAEVRSAAFEEVLPGARRLVTDVFGNYVVQKFLELGDGEQRDRLADAALVGNVLQLSLQMYGCRVVQKALEVSDPERQSSLIAELDGHVLRCVRDQNGNHVVQKCAYERVPPDRAPVRRRCRSSATSRS